MKVLITGGAGFVGSYLARQFKKDGHSVTALDNLHRRGSELNLPLFSREGIEFVHGDIRVPNDLNSLDGQFDVFVEASAEPSVHAGISNSSSYVVDTNLTGTVHCLDFARKRAGAFIFLSTSRVYSIDPLRNIPLTESKTRFEWKGSQGIDESFSTQSARSLYGATKLCSEMMIQEYSRFLGLSSVINRCGVICGPGQFGKVDQGVFSLWLLRHYFGLPVTYMGFEGSGKQVRDLLHPHDLYRLINLQVEKIDSYNADIFNVGGGLESSASLLELTKLCQEVTGKTVPVKVSPETTSVDIPYYVSNYEKCQKTFGWKPGIHPKEMMVEILDWAKSNEKELRQLYANDLKSATKSNPSVSGKFPRAA